MRRLSAILRSSRVSSAQIKLFGKPIRVNPVRPVSHTLYLGVMLIDGQASSDKKQLDIGANLFIGNLDPGVDERTLWDAFSNFGTLVQTAKVARDPGTGASKGYGFVAYDSFESSDAAIAAMDGGFLMNKTISVQYAFKKTSDGNSAGGAGGERHGTEAERLLAAQARKNNASIAPAAPPPMAMGGPGPSFLTGTLARRPLLRDRC